MFFVSEEFLRQQEQGNEIEQTIGDAVQVGEGLFDQPYKSKADQKGSQST